MTHEALDPREPWVDCPEHWEGLPEITRCYACSDTVVDPVVTRGVRVFCSHACYTDYSE